MIIQQSRNDEFAIVTPSYETDFERCQLLTKSIKKYLRPRPKHYIIVDKRDLNHFRLLEDEKTELLCKESLFPYIKRVPFSRRCWINLKGIPIRGWLFQQIIKLSIAQYVSESNLVFIDSDVAFIREYNLLNWLRDDKLRLFRVPGQGYVEGQKRWYDAAAKLLDLPMDKNYIDVRYIGSITTWKRESLLKLYKHLEYVNSRRWDATILRHWHFSEYILYGMFVEYVLKENSGHYFDQNIPAQEYWLDSPMNDNELSQFFSEIVPDQIAILISAKSNTDIAKYKEHILRN